MFRLENEALWDFTKIKKKRYRLGNVAILFLFYDALLFQSGELYLRG